MSPEREEELLAIAGDLAKRLESVPVPLLKDLGRAGREQRYSGEGISASCVGNVASFLASKLEMESFRHFVNLLDQLDPIVGQNQKNPKAEHSVLKRELLRLFQERPKLEAVEHLYVLKWAQRLLPLKKSLFQEGKGPVNEPRAQRSKFRAEPGRFNQLADALRKLRD